MYSALSNCCLGSSGFRKFVQLYQSNTSSDVRLCKIVANFPLLTKSGGFLDANETKKENNYSMKISDLFRKKQRKKERKNFKKKVKKNWISCIYPFFSLSFVWLILIRLTFSAYVIIFMDFTRLYQSLKFFTIFSSLICFFLLCCKRVTDEKFLKIFVCCHVCKHVFIIGLQWYIKLFITVVAVIAASLLYLFILSRKTMKFFCV